MGHKESDSTEWLKWTELKRLGAAAAPHPRIPILPIWKQKRSILKLYCLLKASSHTNTYIHTHTHTCAQMCIYTYIKQTLTDFREFLLERERGVWICYKAEKNLEKLIVGPQFQKLKEPILSMHYLHFHKVGCYHRNYFLFFSSTDILYWVGQEVHSGFLVHLTEKPE